MLSLEVNSAKTNQYDTEISRAPVNCGYHKTDFKYGKLYQWGRKYSQGYSGPLYDSDGIYQINYRDGSYPELVEGTVSLSVGQSKDNENKFYYYNQDWCSQQNDNLWNSGNVDNPVKTEYDPCPDGWRVPTYDELDVLTRNHSSMTTNDDGQIGYWFSGSQPYSTAVPRVFFSNAGFRDSGRDADLRGSKCLYWSSSPYDNKAYTLNISRNGNFYPSSRLNRANGRSVRCVQVTD